MQGALVSGWKVDESQIWNRTRDNSCHLRVPTHDFDGRKVEQFSQRFSKLFVKYKVESLV